MCEIDELYRQADSYLYARAGKCDYKKAVELFSLAAQSGHLKAAQCLARIYRDGEIVVKNMDLSIQYYTQCANLGDISAQFTLGSLYQKGDLVEQNFEKAVFWYTKAAENGLDKAQNNLGNLYKNGTGIEKDYVKAVFWYTKAAESGNSAAQKNLDNLIEYNSDAMYAIGLDYMEKNDTDKSYEWITKAAKHNHTLALKMMGDISAKDGDMEKAVIYYKQAADQGNGEAAELAGDILFKTSVKQAEKYYKLAVRKGINSAIKKLADTYMDNRRLIKNKSKAKTLYEQLNQ